MKIEFIDEVFELPEFAQYDDIPYSVELKCRCGHGDWLISKSFNLIGYCETKNGFMGIMECQKCFEKYRHHITSFGNAFNIEDFKKDAGLILHLTLHRSKL